MQNLHPVFRCVLHMCPKCTFFYCLAQLEGRNCLVCCAHRLSSVYLPWLKPCYKLIHYGGFQASKMQTTVIILTYRQAAFICCNIDPRPNNRTYDRNLTCNLTFICCESLSATCFDSPGKMNEMFCKMNTMDACARTSTFDCTDELFAFCNFPFDQFSNYLKLLQLFYVWSQCLQLVQLASLSSRMSTC